MKRLKALKDDLVVLFIVMPLLAAITLAMAVFDRSGEIKDKLSETFR